MNEMTKKEACAHAGWLLGERLRAAMYVASLDKQIVDDWQAWPEEYHPALWHVVRQAQMLEETYLHEAYEKGIVPSRVYTRVPMIAPPPDPPRPELAPAPPPAPALTATNVVPLRVPAGSQWINGQLVRTA